MNKKKKFVPPKVDVTIKPKSKRKLTKAKATAPLTLSNLSNYFDWRHHNFAQSPILYKIATTIWLYLPVAHRMLSALRSPWYLAKSQ